MEATNLTHHFLIAMPGLQDTHFYRTVIYICAHSEEGAMGIVINRPMSVLLEELLEQMDIVINDESVRYAPVYSGGPVEPERGFVLHPSDQPWHSTMNMGAGLAITTSRDILVAMASGTGPRRSLVALGYAGWGAGQLEHELLENAWLCGPADASVLFDTPAERRWEAAASLLGVNIARMSLEVGHA